MSSSFFDINPFVGLRPFEREDSLYFFGRRSQTAELLEQLHRNRFLAVLGRSGSGKSSLIRAGLIPALLGGFLVEDRDKWLIAIMKPGGSPRHNLAQALLDIASGPVVEISELEQEIEHDQEQAITRYLRDHIAGDTNVLILVDQFEEIFQFRGMHDEQQLARLGPKLRQKQAANRNEASAFLELLLSLPEQHDLPVYVALTMRSDFLGDCDVFPGLPEAMNRSRYLVPRLNRQQLRETVNGPALLSGARIAPRLLDTVVNDVVGKADQLPVLQHALFRTWNTWHKSGEDVLDQHHYEEIGGLDRALSMHAEEALKGLNIDLTKTIFQSLTDTDSDGRRTRRPVTLSELKSVSGASLNDIQTVIERFKGDGRSFLITSVGPNDQVRVDISHESLIRQWRRLRDWIDEEGHSRDQFLDLVSRARGDRALLRDQDLQIATHWNKTSKPTQAWAARYSEREDDFEFAMKYLQKSVDATRRSSRNKKWLVGTLVSLFTIAFFALVVLTNRAVEAEGAARKAQLRAESAESEAESLRIQANDFANLAESKLQEQTVAIQAYLQQSNNMVSGTSALNLPTIEDDKTPNVVAPDPPATQSNELATLGISEKRIWNWNHRRIITSAVALNAQGNTLRLAPGEQFTISFTWSGSTYAPKKEDSYYCPTCIVQLYYGIGGAESENKAQCFVSDIMTPSWSRNGDVKGTLIAPMKAGLYYITQALSLQYNCEPDKVKLSESQADAIAAIVVDPELTSGSRQNLIRRSSSVESR